MYDRAADFWHLLLRVWDRIQKEAKGVRRSHGLSAYWGAHQRFFRQLLASAKVPELARRAVEAVEKRGMAVVIGLQATGESAAVTANAAGEVDGHDEFTSTPTIMLRNLIANHFPTLVHLQNPDHFGLDDDLEIDEEEAAFLGQNPDWVSFNDLYILFF